MSFGFGVGDFLAVIQLANKVRRDFVGAPAEYRAIADEYCLSSELINDLYEC
jgi:hypothetical protein